MAKPDETGRANPLDVLNASSEPAFVTELKDATALSAVDKARDFLTKMHPRLDGMGNIGSTSEGSNGHHVTHVTLYKDDQENRYIAYGDSAEALAGVLGKIPRIDSRSGQPMVYISPNELQHLRNDNYEVDLRDGEDINHDILSKGIPLSHAMVGSGSGAVIDKMRETMENIQANISDTFEKLYQSEQKGPSRGYGI